MPNQVGMEAKDKLLSKRLSKADRLALNLVRLLITRGNLDMIFAVADEYQRLLDSYHGIEPAQVTTAVSLDDKESRALAENLSAIIGKKVVLKPEVNPDVIGGVVVRVGGKLLDGSTRSKLAALKRELVGLEKRK